MLRGWFETVILARYASCRLNTLQDGPPTEGRAYIKDELGFPDASDGARGVAFVESAMRSFASGGVWTGVEAI